MQQDPFNKIYLRSYLTFLLPALALTAGGELAGGSDFLGGQVRRRSGARAHLLPDALAPRRGPHRLRERQRLLRHLLLCAQLPRRPWV